MGRAGFLLFPFTPSALLDFDHELIVLSQEFLVVVFCCCRAGGRGWVCVKGGAGLEQGSRSGEKSCRVGDTDRT